MKRYMTYLVILSYACLAFPGLLAQTLHDAYYPLAVGNAWKYTVHEKGKIRSYITWRVTKADSTKEGVVFQVWPKPMDNDDDALILISLNGQVKELNTSVLLVKNNLKAGTKWDMRVRGNVVRRFTVLASSKPCKGDAFSSSDCVTIEDVDDRLHLRTVTQYARGIGPVRFEYFGVPSSSSPDSVMELVSYHLAP